MFIHNFSPVLIDLGYFEIRWYSIAYIFGIIFCWLYSRKIVKKFQTNHPFFSIKEKDFDDLVGYLIIGIIVGGRIGYVLFYNFDYYLTHLLEILMIWKGGMSFHGGLIGVVITTIFFCKTRNLDIFRFLDVLACAAPIGIFLGRLANFINGELYGKITTMPWSVVFPDGGNVGRHPSQIYEALLEGLILFFLINFLSIKRNMLVNSGITSAMFLIFYSIFRIIGELFREPDIQIGLIFSLISLGTLLSIFFLICGILLMFIKLYRK